MPARVRLGTTMLIAVLLGVGCAAIAHQGGRWQEIVERDRARRDQLPADPQATPIRSAGDYRFTFEHGGLKREYRVHVPRSFRPGRPMPLVVALHGGGGDADFQASDERYGLISKSEAAGFIVAFPNGSSRLPSGALATWNAGACCGGAVRNQVDDVGFLRAVIVRIGRQAGIDRKRVFVIGMSNGAMMAYRMACEAPDILRGIAAVAGTDNSLSCPPGRSVPLIHFHARNDDHVPFVGGSGSRALTQVNYVSVPATIAKWTARNRTGHVPHRVVQRPGATCDRYEPLAGGAPVELCVTDTGGHSWPGGGKQQGRKQPSQAISANDEMWRFFSSL